MAPPPDVRIRPAREADLPALVRLLAALFAIEKDFRPDPQRHLLGLRLLLADPRRCAVLVADGGGDAIGMVTGQLVVSTAEGGASVLVEDVVVDEGARRAGVGAALVRGIERWATERGATRLQLLADDGNGPALAFYARMGWRRTRLVALRRGGT
jgi:GNAT superfamily N-acetyltransferase